MAKAKNKTVATNADVETFIDGVEDEVKQADCRKLMQLMGKATGEPPVMWGSSIVGFGSYHYRYESGREGDSVITGFSPRKAALSVYIISGFSQFEALLEKLGNHKVGKSCLTIKRLDDVDIPTLKKLIERSVAYVRKTYAT